MARVLPFKPTYPLPLPRAEPAGLRAAWAWVDAALTSARSALFGGKRGHGPTPDNVVDISRARFPVMRDPHTPGGSHRKLR